MVPVILQDTLNDIEQVFLKQTLCCQVIYFSMCQTFCHDSVSVTFYFILSTTKAGLERRYEICQKARKFLPQNLLILKKTIDTAKQFMSNQQIGEYVCP